MIHQHKKKKRVSTDTAPLAKTSETPIFFALVICSVQSNGIGMIKRMTSTMMLQKPNMFSTSGAFILHTVVGAICPDKLNIAPIGLQAKMTRRNATSAQTAAMAPIAQDA